MGVLYNQNEAAGDAPARRDAADPSWRTGLFILCAVLGALLGLSFKARDFTRATDIPADNYPALAQEYRDQKRMLKQRGDQDDRTIAQLRDQVDKLEKGTASTSQASKALLDDLSHTKMLAGLTPVAGPGLVVVLNDSKKPMPPLPAGVTPPNIIHDVDINQVANELKAAGAEAISVNGQRLVATTAIRCAGPTIYINNTPQTPPYVIRAIGDGKTLMDALKLPGGVYDQLAGPQGFDPAMVRMQTTPRVTVPAYEGATQPRYAVAVANGKAKP